MVTRSVSEVCIDRYGLHLRTLGFHRTDKPGEHRVGLTDLVQLDGGRLGRRHRRPQSLGSFLGGYRSGGNDKELLCHRRPRQRKYHQGEARDTRRRVIAPIRDVNF